MELFVLRLELPIYSLGLSVLRLGHFVYSLELSVYDMELFVLRLELPIYSLELSILKLDISIYNLKPQATARRLQWTMYPMERSFWRGVAQGLSRLNPSKIFRIFRGKLFPFSSDLHIRMAQNFSFERKKENFRAAQDYEGFLKTGTGPGFFQKWSSSRITL
ncbi:MAG: hypothetical protein LBU18_06395 [Treponema sp.]|jgi:hypothetical protein|nr:hypothetical protein [Treponema sp.]